MLRYSWSAICWLLRPDTTRPSTLPSRGLSPREGSVLGLVVSGLSNQQIADRLYLSINSVKTYIRSTYRKLDVSSRAQAVAWGIQHGFPVDDER